MQAMKLLQRVISSMTVFGLCCSMAIAQDPVFNHYTVDNGLPQNSINCIMQDRKGFMWFGTQAWLCRFDGYGYKIFRNEPGKNSLSNNYIWNIYEDKEEILWITNFGGGVTRFDPATETSTNYKREKNGSKLSKSNTIPEPMMAFAAWIKVRAKLKPTCKHPETTKTLPAIILELSLIRKKAFSG